MNIITLLHTLRDAVHDDSDTQNWCSATYGRTHKVYVNVDVRKMPGENECPYVCLYPTGKTVGREVSEKSHAFDVVVCIHDASLKSAGDAGDNSIEYEGVERLEVFRKYVETALAGADLGGVNLSDIEIDYETIEDFPFLMAGMAVLIKEPITLGSNYLE